MCKTHAKIFSAEFFFFFNFPKKIQKSVIFEICFFKIWFSVSHVCKTKCFFSLLKQFEVLKNEFLSNLPEIWRFEIKTRGTLPLSRCFSISVCQGNVLWWCECNVFSEHSLILQFEIFDINLLNLNICCILLLSGWHITVDIKRKVQEMNSLKHSLCKAHGIIISFP